MLGLMLAGAYGVRCAQVPIHMISTGFNESHFEFRVNQESYGFISVIIGFIIQKNMGLKPKFCLYLVQMLSNVRKQNFTSLAAILKMAAYR